MLISILAAVGVFALLIIVHEAGHFAMAKRLGVRVLRFSIGYPPRIFGIRRGETDYAIGATPLGGYVRMLGDEVAEEPSPANIESYLREIELDLVAAAKARQWSKPGTSPDETIKAMATQLGQSEGTPRGPGDGSVVGGELTLMAEPVKAPTPQTAVPILGRELKPEEALLLREIRKHGSAEQAIKIVGEARPSVVLESFKLRAFPNQSLAKRTAIVLAGPFANLLFAPILMTIVFMFGLPILLPIIGKIEPGLPAQAAGLRAGDRIVSIDGRPIGDWEELSATIKASGGAALGIQFERRVDGALKHMSTVIKPANKQEKTIYGNSAATWVIGIMPRGDQGVRRIGPLRAVRDGFFETWNMTKSLMIGIAAIVKGTTPVRQALGGPIMIAEMAGRVAHQGMADLTLFTVMLSIELGIINLVPVPLLDGGHLLFFALEGMRGKPLKLRHREIAMEVGLFLLVILMAFVILNDISRIVQG
jgi:regulator of sigma E protease